MEQKYQNIIILTILLVSVAWFVILTINGQNIKSRYEGNPCEKYNFSSFQIQGYNGTLSGGYSCFLKDSKLTIYFNPQYPNTPKGSSPEEYKFMCDVKYAQKSGLYCYLQNKFMRVNNTNAT
jgi:hypothetical protein